MYIYISCIEIGTVLGVFGARHYGRGRGHYLTKHRHSKAKPLASSPKAQISDDHLKGPDGRLIKTSGMYHTMTRFRVKTLDPKPRGCANLYIWAIFVKGILACTTLEAVYSSLGGAFRQ